MPGDDKGPLDVDKALAAADGAVEKVPTTTSLAAAAEPAPEPTKDRATRRRERDAETAAKVAAADAGGEGPALDLDEDGTPRLHHILTNAEYRTAQDGARDQLVKERRLAAIKAVKEEELQRLRNEEGMVTGDKAKDQMVQITLDLAPHSDRVTINMAAYWHGFTYTVPRHVADTIRDMQARGWVHQDEIDGKSRTQHYQANRKTIMNKVGGVQDAPANYGLADRFGRVAEARANAG